MINPVSAPLMSCRRRKLLSNMLSLVARGSLKAVQWALLCLAALILVSCVAIDQLTPEERVEQRAVEQSQALLEQDYERALQYVVPSYRDGPLAGQYKANFSGAAFWIRFEPRWVRCEEGPQPESCSVRIWIYNNIPWSGRGAETSRGSDVPISWDSTWIKVDGEWYQYL